MLSDFLFPITCISCGKKGSYLCKECKKKLIAHPEICPICHNYSIGYKVCNICKNKTSLDGLIIGFSYQSFLKKLIIALKYKHQSSVADFLVKRMNLVLETNKINRDMNLDNTLITYVPSHRYRHHFIKGYNQSLFLAKRLAELRNLPYSQVFKKIKHTKSQVSLNREQRKNNLKNKFILNENFIKNYNHSKLKYIIICDDITTTGSTISELSIVVKKKYPDIHVWGIVVGRHNS